MVVDYERAWLRLKEELLKKGSHGQRDLLAQMGSLEVECALPEGQELFDARPVPRRSEASDERSRVIAGRA